MTPLMNYLTGPDDPDALKEAAAALSPNTVRRLHAVLTDALTCASARSRLPELASARELGLPLTADQQAVAGHLAQCPDCAAAWADLLALARLAEAGLPAPPTVPRPDLSFLPATPVAAWQQVGARRHQFTASLNILIGRAAAAFRSLPAGLLPQPVLVPALRAGGETMAAQRLALPPAPGSLAAELTVSPVEAGAQIDLRLTHAATQQSLAQVPITLFNAEHQRLRRTDTDAEGRAAFADLPPGRYYLSVRTVEGHWELTLVLAPLADAADL